MKELLLLCKTEAPLKHIYGNLYKQSVGVAIDSPFKPTFANIYMGDIEEKVFEDKTIIPGMYDRYVDNIFLEVKNGENLIKIKQQLEVKLILKFAIE